MEQDGTPRQELEEAGSSHPCAMQCAPSPALAPPQPPPFAPPPVLAPLQTPPSLCPPLQLTVHNDLPSDMPNVHPGLSVHWHGFDMRGYPCESKMRLAAHSARAG